MALRDRLLGDPARLDAAGLGRGVRHGSEGFAVRCLRWLGERPEVGVTLLSAAAYGPVMGPREPLSAALQASRGRLAPEVWARAEQGGRRATDLELLRLVRG